MLVSRAVNGVLSGAGRLDIRERLEQMPQGLKQPVTRERERDMRWFCLGYKHVYNCSGAILTNGGENCADAQLKRLLCLCVIITLRLHAAVSALKKRFSSACANSETNPCSASHNPMYIHIRMQTVV